MSENAHEANELVKNSQGFYTILHLKKLTYITIVHHTDNAKVRKICYCSIENRCLFIECKERSIVCTILLIFVSPTLTPDMITSGMLMNFKQCDEIVNGWLCT